MGIRFLLIALSMLVLNGCAPTRTTSAGAVGVDRDLRAESAKKLNPILGAAASAEGGEAQPQQ